MLWFCTTLTLIRQQIRDVASELILQLDLSSLFANAGSGLDPID